LLQSELRSKITYVSQDTTLFHKTILENIKYSKSEATFEEIENAAKIAEASDFIKLLSNSYDTMV
jgi:ABC-type multidrug transport system fused ATPase/permease subunit